MRKLVVVAAAALMVGALLSPSAGAAKAEKTSGTFAPVPGHGDWGVTGTAKMIRTSAGSTLVKVKVEGLDPGATYPSHVHNQPCSTGGGGHYQNDVGGATTPPNELWPSTDSASPGLTANAKGKAVGTDRADWLARPEAQSVVIHLYSNTAIRVACADLS